MGGYDAQTIAGVVSTSTHGSGLAFGPFPDACARSSSSWRAGEVVRLEPEGGPTDPQRFEDPRLQLIQDDDLFAAAICGIGTLGLLYRLMLDVREKFWLNEVRTLDTWETRPRHRSAPDGVLGEPATTTSCSSTPTPARTASTGCW